MNINETKKLIDNSLSIINETKMLIENSLEKYNEKNKKYYNDVLDFLNLLFDEKNNQILKLKFKKITLNDDIFLFYNEIINKYKLNKNLFDIANFNLDELHESTDIINLTLIITNNLLEKLNYEMYKYTDHNTGKKKLKIKLINY